MNVVISGGGVAGLTTAAAIRRLPHIKSIVVLEASKGYDSTTCLGHIGLWNPSLQCLKQLGSFESLRKHLEFVGKSSYRDVRGNFLAQPQKGLQGPESKVTPPIPNRDQN
jgi:2-polyprenyl-6-methoxyphenol hydroxylase-like FAD-dependent oxidoreductase